MIYLDEATKTWAREGAWCVAPGGLEWIAKGSYLIVGNSCKIGNNCKIGDRVKIDDRVTIGAWVTICAWAKIGDRVTIGDGAKIGDCATIGDRVKIGNRVKIGAWATIGDRSKIGDSVTIGDRSKIGDCATIGDSVTLGDDSSDVVDLGFADGYRKCIAQVKGIAYIGAGCRWFTLDEALKHWGNHEQNRDLTMCLMQSAVAIAGLKGWAGEADVCAGRERLDA